MKKLALVTSLALALAACGGDNDGSSDNNTGGGSEKVSFDAKPVAKNIAENVIVPTYQNLNNATANLQAKVDALIDGATEAEVKAAQQAWKEARVPWESSEAFLFGPVDSLGVDPAIDSWPLNTADLEAQLVQGKTSEAVINAAGDDLKGFHAVERLLFGNGVDDNQKAASEFTTAEITYLTNLVKVMKGRTQALVDGWTLQYDPTNAKSGGYLDQVTKIPSTKYKNGSAIIEEIIDAMVGIVDEIGNTKIADSLGSSIDKADTTTVESQYSWNSLTDFHNNAQSALNVYTGKLGFNPNSDAPSKNDNGVYAFVAAHNPALADQVLAEVKDAYNKIALIDGDGDINTTNIEKANQIPFREAIKDTEGRKRAQAAIDALNKVKTTVDTKVKPLLGETNFAS